MIQYNFLRRLLEVSGFNTHHPQLAWLFQMDAGILDKGQLNGGWARVSMSFFLVHSVLSLWLTTEDCFYNGHGSHGNNQNLNWVEFLSI